jgi:hypothetical protein
LIISSYLYDESKLKDMQSLSTVDTVITYLVAMDVDGDTMEYIIKEVGMKQQMLRQLIMSSPLNEVQTLLEEKLEA